jgi:hypothetical protein
MDLHLMSRKRKLLLSILTNQRRALKSGKMIAKKKSNNYLTTLKQNSAKPRNSLKSLEQMKKDLRRSEIAGQNMTPVSTSKMRRKRKWPKCPSQTRIKQVYV